jgi:predicted ArsR family transcriptional regulator
MTEVMSEPDVTPAQLTILRLLAIEGRTVAELSEMLEITPTAVRQHIRVLEAAGLVTAERRRATKGRPSSVYAATTETLKVLPKRYDILAEAVVGEISSSTPASEMSRVSASLARRIMDVFREEKPEGRLEERLESTMDLLLNLKMNPELVRGGGEWRIKLHNCLLADQLGFSHHLKICDVERIPIAQMDLNPHGVAWIHTLGNLNCGNHHSSILFGSQELRAIC